ncbi:MAG TPA: molybdopterin-dependent oxidoreductase [Thiobacillus sp.]|nr:MAG: nitrate reductase [Hydrogenophilales bacterium 28-61-11]OYZ58723.1 MAG: nitrate reductase [Hydrogenophilales bacterium 16-61-112]HQT30787.1 molybdopterin-dependent oxidoreductase [Thiobacillus sp.]HQT69591.1 molybdopterin-dependent oxidoreductase [Thiobacillus sp.]
MSIVSSVCCYCGTGCGVLIETEAGKITGVRGDPAHPANQGKLCTKGATLHLSAQAGGRALVPELRTERAAKRQPTSWAAALDHVADKFNAVIREHGPDAVGFYISGQLTTEAYYVFNKLAKGLVGTNNVDTNSRLCMSSAVAGYKATLGADSPPGCYDDIDHAGVIFIAGSNTAFAHPILFRRIEAARKANPALKLIVVDPRRTDTAAEADLHLSILPGTDVALFHAMLNVMLWEELIDRDFIAAHTDGWDALRATVREYSPEKVAPICGVSVADIVQAARWFAAGPTLSLYCQGLNQSSCGTDKNATLINLHLASGQIGKPGAAPLSLTGQPNAMGGREVGGLANLLSAHRDMGNPAHRAEVAALWGVDEVPATPGKTAIEMFEAVKRGEIKALWIACTNPAQSLPNQALVHEALQTAECVVLQEAFADTETARYADVLLPASAWGETEGTVTNSERCITRVHAAVPPPGKARPDWAIVCDFARRLLPEKGARLFPYADAEAVFNEHRESTRGRDLDITGLSYALLEQAPQQWPFAEGSVTGALRLYADGIYPTASGRARFHNTTYIPVSEAIDARYPLHLNTGRLRDQWHGMSRTGLVARLYSHVEEPLLSMARSDMERRRLKDGELVRVKSRRGSLVVKVGASDELRGGQTFMPMHWGGRFMAGRGVNALTLDVVDPVSRQPELKHCAVQVEKVELPYRRAIMRRGDGASLLRQAQPFLEHFDYATAGLTGRDKTVLVFQAASMGPLPEELVQEMDAAFGLDDPLLTMSYQDARRGIWKKARVEDGVITGARLSGETAAQDWLKDLIAAGASAMDVRTWLLAPVTQPPAGGIGRGRIICNCLDVAEPDIVAAIAAGADLAALQATLNCGTECGSCVPELKRLLMAGRAVA